MLIFVVIGACGCMKKNIDGNVYKNAIISYLEEKYHEEFTVMKLYQEFEGNSGMAVRALCAKEENKDYFTVYCYLDSTVSDEIIIIDGNEHSIVDSYTEVLFQNAILDEVDVLECGGCFVRCKVSFNAGQPSKSDIASGINFCLQKQKLDPYVKLYVIVQCDTSTEKIESKLKEILNKYEPCTGYIYLVYMEEYDENEIKKVYEEKQNDFGNYLANTDYADIVEFILYKCDTGMQDKQYIKE